MIQRDDVVEEIWKAFNQRLGRRDLGALEVLGDFANDKRSGQITSDTINQLLAHWSVRRELGEYSTPAMVTNLMAGLAKRSKPKSVLDPTCGLGSLLHQVVDACDSSIVHGVEINHMTASIADAVLGDKADVISGDILQEGNTLNAEYDLIVADPPLNLRIDSKRGLELTGDVSLSYLGELLVIWGCRRLSPHGMMAVVLGPTALRRNQLVDLINKNGCAIKASFHVPPGTRFNTGVSTQVLVIQQGSQEHLFVGQLSEDTDHMNSLIGNFFNRKSGRLPSLGRMCDLADFLGYEALEAGHRLKIMTRKLNLSEVLFSELEVTRARMTYADAKETGDHEPGSLLYIVRPIDGLFLDLNEVPNATQGVDRISLDTKRVHAQYLIKWLDTDLGRTAIRAASTPSVARLGIAPHTLNRLKCYLPPLDEQLKYLESVRKLDELRALIEEIEHDCWSGESDASTILVRAQTVNQTDTYEGWLESLPFPLASILWRHHASPADPRIKLQILLHFFEGLAEFLATVHLSAFISHESTWREIQEPFLARMSKQNMSLERATFGAWKMAVEFLSAEARRMLGDDNRRELVLKMYAANDEQWLRVLCDPKISTALSQANGIRNTVSHGGAMGPGQAASIENDLKGLVGLVRSTFGRRWGTYELIQAEEMTFVNGSFQYQVPLLMGTRSLFSRVDRITSTPMEKGRLYLLADGSESGLQLLPFVRIMPSPSNVENACYFYNRDTGDGLRFVSYHFEQDAAVCKTFPGTAEAMRQLTQLQQLPGANGDGETFSE